MGVWDEKPRLCPSCGVTKPSRLFTWQPIRGKSPSRGNRTRDPVCRACRRAGKVRRGEPWDPTFSPKTGVANAAAKAYARTGVTLEHSTGVVWYRLRPSELREVFATQDGRCYYCGDQLVGRFDTSHKTPLPLGGSNGPENIAFVCHSCMSQKGGRTEEEYRTWLAGQDGPGV